MAGRAALNEIIRAARQSRDLDLFHDTVEALAASWDADRGLLEESGYEVRVIRERPAFVEALVGRGGEQVLVQWTCDSAYRFFPLLEHPDLGLTLNPFDLATNKVLALVGRLEPRDFVDVIRASEAIQPLGLLIWAASGKDPGLSPGMILSQARRSSRYTAPEFEELAFEGPPPDAADLARRWAAMTSEAEAMIDILGVETLGTCVLEAEGGLFRGTADELRRALAEDRLTFHAGTIRGAFPHVAPRPPRKAP